MSLHSVVRSQSAPEYWNSSKPKVLREVEDEQNSKARQVSGLGLGGWVGFDFGSVHCGDNTSAPDEQTSSNAIDSPDTGNFY